MTAFIYNGVKTLKVKREDKSEKNKTLDLPLDECREYADRCVCPKGDISPDDIKNAVFCTDFFKTASRLPENSFDLIIVDPPYNLRKDYDGEVFSVEKAEKYSEFTRKWLKEIVRVAKADATVYVCCDWRTSVIAAPILSEYLTVRNRITWQREKGRGAAGNWKNSMEDIWFCTVGKKYYFNLDAVKQRRIVKAPYKSDGVPKDWEETDDGNFRMTCPSNFWDDITVPFWSMAENTAHPTQKPEKLIAKLILASSKPGDSVFDPFGGSGTTAVVCKKLGRNFTVTEKSELYCAWTQIRLDEAGNNKRIQGLEDGVFVKR